LLTINCHKYRNLNAAKLGLNFDGLQQVSQQVHTSYLTFKIGDKGEGHAMTSMQAQTESTSIAPTILQLQH
jgi:hypothetical protein